jgi:glycosyltransferase involved in cell wall biosynthesis
MQARLGVVLKGYPRLSETFIAQEIRELERQGFVLELISLRHPTDRDLHPVHREIKAKVHYLPEYLYQEPLRVLRAWWRCRKLPGYRNALRVFVRDFRRDLTPNRIRRFGQGLVIAAEYAPHLSALYAHFIHTPASAARYGAMIAGLPFAISAHAKDIWTTPGWELAEKLDAAHWCVTCTKGGLRELQSHAAMSSKVHLAYHGIDLSRYQQAPERVFRNGADPDDPIRLLSVGRAVAKKGFDTLIDALAGLPEDLHWRWTHIGGGPLHGELKKRAGQVDIADRCVFMGARSQEEVLEAYRTSDIFVLPCRIDENGDRDGLPNVLVEAQSQALAVITTPISGIPELIEDGLNGRFVPPDDAQALATAIELMSRIAMQRLEMGKNGEKIVGARFDHKTTIVELAGKIEGLLQQSQSEAAQ